MSIKCKQHVPRSQATADHRNSSSIQNPFAVALRLSDTPSAALPCPLTPRHDTSAPPSAPPLCNFGSRGLAERGETRDQTQRSRESPRGSRGGPTAVGWGPRRDRWGLKKRGDRQTGAASPPRAPGDRHLLFGGRPRAAAPRRLPAGRPVLLLRQLQELADAPLPGGDGPHAHRVPPPTAAVA